MFSASDRPAAAARQEPVSVSNISIETYRRVLDLVFPRDAGNFRDFRKEFALTLRFSPSFDVESQVNITKYSDGRLDVVAYTLPEGSPSIIDQINTIYRRTGRGEADDLAKQINVRRQVLSDTRRVRQLLTRFNRLRFTAQFDTSITLDGTGFQLWYEAVSNEGYYVLAGSEPGHDRGDHPVVRWMNEVRQAVFK